MDGGDEEMRRIAWLRDLFRGVQHPSHVPFLSHLVATGKRLASWGAPLAVRRAGTFHSVYGTAYFTPSAGRAPSRDEVRRRLGVEAERLVWLWSRVDRRRLDPGAGHARGRGGETVCLSAVEARALVEIWAADVVEQIERTRPDERGFATGLLEVLPYASTEARSAVSRIAPLLSRGAQGS